MINVYIEKNPTENSLTVLKRFTKKVQSAGVLPRVRSLRYNKRKPSEYTKKKRTLSVLKRRADTALQVKLGKIAEKTSR